MTKAFLLETELHKAHGELMRRQAIFPFVLSYARNPSCFLSSLSLHVYNPASNSFLVIMGMHVISKATRGVSQSNLFQSGGGTTRTPRRQYLAALQNVRGRDVVICV